MSSPLDRSSTPNNQNPYSDPSLMESDADKSFSQSTLQQTSQKHITSNDAAIMQREREIMDIAKGIIELADIFKDLQTMVIDQGTMLDRIDYNVEKMAVDVKAADKELIVVCTSRSVCSYNRFANQEWTLGDGISEKDNKEEDYFLTCSSCGGHVYSSTCQAKTARCFQAATSYSSTGRRI